MKFKRYTTELRYKERINKVTDYELLTKYNPLFIAKKKSLIRSQIEDMYHLNHSHVTCCDVRGVITVSYPLDKLVIWIIDSKERLEHYEAISENRMTMLKNILINYSPKQQKEVMLFMRTSGTYRVDEVIDKLQRDLYKVSSHERIKRNREREANKLINIYKKRLKYELHA
ncbi:pathogenicity island protein [Macrococcus capreoli]